jgi:hypothetical protein
VTLLQRGTHVTHVYIVLTMRCNEDGDPVYHIHGSHKKKMMPLLQMKMFTELDHVSGEDKLRQLTISMVRSSSRKNSRSTSSEMNKI